MDAQILRRPEPGQIWRHRNGGYYHVIAIANEEHKHEGHPVDVVYRSMRQDNGQPSHWWTRPLAAWHEKMTFVAEHNEAVPPIGRVYEVRQGPERDGWGVSLQIDFPRGLTASDVGFIPGATVRVYPAKTPRGGYLSLEQQGVEDARLTGNASGLYGRVVACHGNGAQHYTLGLKVSREDMPDHIVNNELVRVIFNRAKRPAGDGNICAANHTGHNFGPYGPNGVTQCEYCGEAY